MTTPLQLEHEQLVGTRGQGGEVKVVQGDEVKVVLPFGSGVSVVDENGREAGLARLLDEQIVATFSDKQVERLLCESMPPVDATVTRAKRSLRYRIRIQIVAEPAVHTSKQIDDDR